MKIKGIKTEKTKTIDIRGEQETLPVYKFLLTDLIYNKHNDRINVELSGIDLDDSDYSKMNEEIEKCIWNSEESKNKKTYQNIKKTMQREAGVVTESGIIVDGNRRFTCLRKLSRDLGDAKYKYFEAVILNDSLELDTKEIKRLELNLQHRMEEKVDYDQVNKAVAIKKTIDEKDFTIKEYALETGIKEKEIKKFKEIAGLFDEFLVFFEKKGNYKIIKDMKLYGSFHDIHGSLGIEEEYANQRYYLYIYMIQNKNDQKKIRSIIKALKSEEILDRYEEKLDDISDFAEEIIEKDIKLFRSDSKISDKIEPIFQEMVAKHEMIINSGGGNQLKILKKMNQQLEEIDKEEFQILRESNTELNEIFEKIKKTINGL